MRRKMYWGIAVLIVILFTVGVFLLTQRNIDMEPDVVFEPPSPEVIQKIKDDIAERNAQEAAKPPPPGASPNGHWHDGVWHNEPHVVEKQDALPTELPSSFQTKIVWVSDTRGYLPHAPPLNAEPQTDATPFYRRLYKRYGVEPPPPGYAYVRSDPNVITLDKNGNPILYKRGEALFEITKITGFAPTYEQYQQYQQLRARRDAARNRGDKAEAERLIAEIAKFKADARGSIPFISSSLATETHLYEAARTKASERATKVMQQAYIEMGLGYMVENNQIPDMF